jgi:hypothetical protein
MASDGFCVRLPAGFGFCPLQSCVQSYGIGNVRDWLGTPSEETDHIPVPGYHALHPYFIKLFRYIFCEASNDHRGDCSDVRRALPIQSVIFGLCTVTQTVAYSSVLASLEASLTMSSNFRTRNQGSTCGLGRNEIHGEDAT